MSNQSGIQADASVNASLADFVANDGILAAAFKIQNTEIVPGAKLAYSKPDSVHADLINFMSSEPAYIFCKAESKGVIIFITYVPMNANVREKMLYASSQSSFLKQISVGVQVISLFASAASDVTSNDLSGITSNVDVAHLSKKEEVLQQIKNAEDAEAMHGTTSRRSHVTKGVCFEIDKEAQKALTEFAGTHLTSLSLSFKINSETEQIELSAKSNNFDVQTLASHISNTSPQYTLFRDLNDRISFIYTCPGVSQIKEKMTYSSNKAHFVRFISGMDIEIERKLEASDPNDLDLGNTTIESNASTASTLSFSKPKGPKRR